MEIVLKHDKGRRFIAQADGHRVVIGYAKDDPPEKNSMSAGQLFVAALGACVGSYVVGFCERHDIPHEGMTIQLDYESAESPSRVAFVNVTINLPQPVPEKYRAAILRVADQCYVTQSIQHQTPVKVHLADDGQG